MASTSPTPARWALPALIALTLATWGVVAWDWSEHGAPSLLPVATACMFTAMLVAWPTLTGVHVRDGHLRQARLCVECRSMVWPPEEALGFCLRCGSTRPTIGAAY